MDYAEARAAFFQPRPAPAAGPSPPAGFPGRATPARALRDAIEPLATICFWAEPAYDSYAAAGLDFLAGYVWGRASVLGEPEGTVVASAFGVFEPGLVRSVYDGGRAACGLAQVRAAKEAGAVESLRQVLGQPAELAEWPGVVATLRRATEAADPTGRPMHAGAGRVDIDGLLDSADAHGVLPVPVAAPRPPSSGIDAARSANSSPQSRGYRGGVPRRRCSGASRPTRGWRRRRRAGTGRGRRRGARGRRLGGNPRHYLARRLAGEFERQWPGVVATGPGNWALDKTPDGRVLLDGDRWRSVAVAAGDARLEVRDPRSFTVVPNDLLKPPSRFRETSRSATTVLAWCNMRTLYLRNVPDEVVERLERLAARDGASVAAVAVRELAEVSRRADNAALLGDLPHFDFEPGEVAAEVERGRAER